MAGNADGKRTPSPANSLEAYQRQLRRQRTEPTADSSQQEQQRQQQQQEQQQQLQQLQLLAQHQQQLQGLQQVQQQQQERQLQLLQYHYQYGDDTSFNASVDHVAAAAAYMAGLVRYYTTANTFGAPQASATGEASNIGTPADPQQTASAVRVYASGTPHAILSLAGRPPVYPSRPQTAGPAPGGETTAEAQQGHTGVETAPSQIPPAIETGSITQQSNAASSAQAWPSGGRDPGKLPMTAGGTSPPHAISAAAEPLEARWPFPIPHSRATQVSGTPAEALRSSTSPPHGPSAGATPPPAMRSSPSPPRGPLAGAMSMGAKRPSASPPRELSAGAGPSRFPSPSPIPLRGSPVATDPYRAGRSSRSPLREESWSTEPSHFVSSSKSPSVELSSSPSAGGQSSPSPPPGVPRTTRPLSAARSSSSLPATAARTARPPGDRSRAAQPSPSPARETPMGAGHSGAARRSESSPVKVTLNPRSTDGSPTRVALTIGPSGGLPRPRRPSRNPRPRTDAVAGPSGSASPRIQIGMETAFRVCARLDWRRLNRLDVHEFAGTFAENYNIKVDSQYPRMHHSIRQPSAPDDHQQWSLISEQRNATAKSPCKFYICLNGHS
jgi:hypothetical protein